MAAAMAAASALVLISLDLLPPSHAHAEVPPEEAAADAETTPELRGQLPDDRPAFPIGGLYPKEDDQDPANSGQTPPGEGPNTPPANGLDTGESPPLAPPPAAPLNTAARFQAVYNVSLGRFNLGNFSISGAVQNGQYNLRGNGKFSVLKGWVFHWQGNIRGSGRATTEGPVPKAYDFSQTDGKYKDRVKINFGDGYVQSVTIWPKPRPYPGEIPVTKEQVQAVVDPLSALFLSARSNDPRGDLSVCNQTLPVFDGRSRYDLVLTPKRRVMVQNRGNANYSGPAAVCKVKFVPISGYPHGDSGMEQLRRANNIEAWLVPIRGTGMYVPYRIVMPTAAGDGVAVLVSLRGGRTGRAQAR